MLEISVGTATSLLVMGALLIRKPLLIVPYVGPYGALLWSHRNIRAKMIDETDHGTLKLMYQADYRPQGLVEFCEQRWKNGERALSPAGQVAGKRVMSADEVQPLNY